MSFEFPMLGETKRLDASERASQPDSFIALRHGVTHYQLGGPANAPVVALVHGFAMPYFVWEPTYHALVEAGFRTLRYDLYGRGFSDRPFVSYDLDLFDEQLVDLLDALETEACRAVMGLSMGGVLAANFAVRHPERVEKLILVDPAGFKMDFPFVYDLLRLPVLGEVMLSLLRSRDLVRLAAGNLYDPEDIRVFSERYQPQMAYKGFKRAILSTIRAQVAEGGVEIYQKLGQRPDLPVQLFWGELDETVPFTFSKAFMQAVPHAEFHPLADCGHIPHYEQPEILNPLIMEFIKR